MSVSLQRGAITGAEPLALADVKLHLHVDFADEDPLITSLIKAAREKAEQVTGRSIVKSTWTYSLDSFPYRVSDTLPAPSRVTPDKLMSAWATWQVIELPRAPLVSVESVQYVGGNDSQYTALDKAVYVVDMSTTPGRIFPVLNSYWPATQIVPNAVQIGFTAGYDTVPEPIKLAMLLMVANWYRQREDSKDIPRAAEYILSGYRSQPFGLAGAV